MLFQHALGMASLQTPVRLTALPPWEQLFYQGDRLRAEVTLFGAAFAGSLKSTELVTGCAQIQRSHGVATSEQPWSSFTDFQSLQPEPVSPREAWQQLLPVADLPDALLFWALYRRLPALAEAEPGQRIRFFQRLATLIHQHLPGRPDLLYQVLMRDVTGSLFRTAPKQWVKPGHWYSRPEAYLPQLQVAWVQGRYQDMWLGCLRAQLDGRYFRSLSHPRAQHHWSGGTLLASVPTALRAQALLFSTG